MKKTLILLCTLALAGCTQTSVTTPTFSLNRVSIFQKVQAGFTVSTNGTMALTGYSNDGGNAALGTVVEAAVKTAIESATKP